MYTKKDMGKAFRYLRLKVLFKTQTELSNEIGLAQATISKIECGNLAIDAITLFNLLKKYNISDQKFKMILDTHVLYP